MVAALVALSMAGTALGRSRGENAPLAPPARLPHSSAPPPQPRMRQDPHPEERDPHHRQRRQGPHLRPEIPDGYDRSRAHRLVFKFHWPGGTWTDVSTGRTVETGTWAYYGLQRLADNSAVFVAPQGLDNGWADTGGEDVTFVDDMLRRIEADLCVDTTQRFALGFSHGAAMSYALACSRATVFRAVAIQSGGQLSGCGRRHPAHRLPRSARPQRQRPRHRRRTGDARPVRQEQRLHPPEPALNRHREA
ncbi:hypothetical protein SGLAM104S_02733 [Streptomyces glaucescens]